MRPDPNVTRKPAGGKAFALEPHRKIPSELLRPGRWYYATPISPATSPSDDDQALYDTRNKAFENGWVNVVLPGGGYSPLRWRVRADGKKELEGAIDSGAFETVCVTLPEDFWPADDEAVVVSSLDGTRAMTVTISSTTGEVTVVGVTQNSSTTESQIVLSDSTTNNVTSTAHGFAPKTPADATYFLDGAATAAWAKVKDSDLSTSDITTNDVTTAKHGFTPKAPNDTAKFLRGDATWAAPGSATSAVATDAIWDAKGDLAAATGADAASKLAVGTDGQVLTADSAQTTGIKWATAASGSTDGWVDDTADTWTYASATTFTISGVDRTSSLTKGTRLKLTQTTVKYFVVVSSSFSTNTTVTITGGSDYTFVNAAVSANYHSYAANPQGYPGRFAFTTGATGFSSLTRNVGKFSVVGHDCTLHIDLFGVSNATTIQVTAPIATLLANVAGIGQSEDNGAAVVGPGLAWFNTAASAALDIYKGTSFTLFTNSGNKGIQVTVVYEF